MGSESYIQFHPDIKKAEFNYGEATFTYILKGYLDRALTEGRFDNFERYVNDLRTIKKPIFLKEIKLHQNQLNHPAWKSNPEWTQQENDTIKKYQLLVDEIDKITPEVMSRIKPVSARAGVAYHANANNRGFFSGSGWQDAKANKPMDKYILELLGTPNEKYAHTYVESYKAQKEGKFGSSRKISNKSRKTRRVKKLNGRK